MATTAKVKLVLPLFATVTRRLSLLLTSHFSTDRRKFVYRQSHFHFGLLFVSQYFTIGGHCRTYKKFGPLVVTISLSAAQRRISSTGDCQKRFVHRQKLSHFGRFGWKCNSDGRRIKLFLTVTQRETRCVEGQCLG